MFGIGRGTVDLARASARAGVRASAVDEIRSIATRLADRAVPAFRPFDLWKSRLPGIPLKPLHSQPREIPYDGDRLCLELDQRSEHWASLLDAPGFVIGVSGVLPNEPQVDCFSVNR